MPSTALPPLTLVLGDEELLVSRAVADCVAAVRSADPQADVREYDGRSLGPEVLMDLASPSLFGDRRLVVVRDAHELVEDVRTALGEFVADQSDDVVLVIAHAGGTKGKRLVDAAKSAGARVVPCAKVTKPAERLMFVQQELLRAGHEATAGACRALLDAVGGDLRELSAACSQLAADTPGVIDEPAVARYFRGRADASGFVVADRAVDGDSEGALAELRFAAAAGVPPVLVVSALAQQIRTIARVASAGRASAESVAKDLKLPPWRVDKARRQSRGWTPESLVRAHAAVARADAEVKGGGTDPAYALERAVLEIAAGRGRGR
jgi:DNA polymerase-3 subunit delta